MATVDASKGQALRQLVRFIGNYYRLGEAQLQEVQDAVTSLVDTAMDGAKRVTQIADQARAKAEAKLSDASLVPDEASAETMKAAQDAVDNIFDAASTNIDGLSDSSAEAAVRRAGGKFSKQVEAISAVATDVERILLELVGALSADDVIRQQLENVFRITGHINDSLNEIDRLPADKFTTEAIQNFKKDLLTYALHHYKSSEEKAHFRKVFPHWQMEEPPPKKSHFELAEMLTEFLADMARLIAEHINHSNEIISATVQSSMSAIHELNSTNDAALKHADSALLHVDGERVERSIKEIEASDETGGAESAFTEIENLLKEVSSDLEAFMMELMGAMSIDDVVQQRMDVLGRCLFYMANQLEEVAQDIDQSLDPENITKITDDILGTTLSYYRSKAERHTFDEIFPDKVDMKKKAA